jgi:Rrf2 family protein
VTAPRSAPPLRITERIDYAIKSVLYLSLHLDEYVSAETIADHYGMSLKLVARVLWCLRVADILESRAGWNGGFRLSRPAEAISLQSVIVAAAEGERGAKKRSSDESRDGWDPSAAATESRTADLVAGFWQALDNQVQDTLTAFTVANLAADHVTPGA